VTGGKVSRLSLPIMFYANDPAVRFSAVAGTTLTANYSAPAAVAEQQQSRASASTAVGLTSQPQFPQVTQ
jgi:hypothetical protein